MTPPRKMIVLALLAAVLACQQQQKAPTTRFIDIGAKANEFTIADQDLNNRESICKVSAGTSATLFMRVDRGVIADNIRVGAVYLRKETGGEVNPMICSAKFTVVRKGTNDEIAVKLEIPKMPCRAILQVRAGKLHIADRTIEILKN